MTQDMQKLITFLESEHACEEALAWLREQPSIEHAWYNCDRADWLFWLLDTLDYQNDRAFRLISVSIVRETPLHDGRKVVDLLKNERSLNALDIAEKFANGLATDADMAAASVAARAAARAAASVAASAAASVAAWDAASAAAWAAARAAARDAAWAAASKIVRRYIALSDVLQAAGGMSDVLRDS